MDLARARGLEPPLRDRQSRAFPDGYAPTAGTPEGDPTLPPGCYPKREMINDSIADAKSAP